MLYRSTRGGAEISSSEAIVRGIADDGGLFVPAELPRLSEEDFSALAGQSYHDRAVAILSRFLSDFSQEELSECVSGAYGGEKFETETPAPLKELYGGVYMLELWHGPTSAFKDMALQILPHFMIKSARKNALTDKIVILVATSGDTGKAALEGFKDVPGTEIAVFYPRHGVSDMQRLQMVTQQGDNVHVCGIEGNFDDAQTGVKKIFTDPELKSLLAENGLRFSSANSINWGRLVPQGGYYVSAYCDLLAEKAVGQGDPINIVVPTGNFGNILAAYYAKKMGVPVNKLICASNKNKILTDFINTGIYDRNREFYTTMSPSMDILISSNLERLLFDLSGNSPERVVGWMQELAEQGSYEVGGEVLSAVRQAFYGGYCDEQRTKQVIGDIYREHHYLCDTHTAVGVRVYQDYREETGDETPTVIASTASPYKFPKNVLAAVDGREMPEDEFSAAEALETLTGVKIPSALTQIKNLPVRHGETGTAAGMQRFITKRLGITE